MATAFPFSAIVGQDDMKLAILIAAVDPGVGGVLVFGDRGTGKSTAVRSLAALLPMMDAVQGCRYGCDPLATSQACEDCTARRAQLGATVGGKAPTKGKAAAKTVAKTVATATPLKAHKIPVPVVDLPLGATEDRVVGALDLERALSQGVKAFEPGLLARAHRGFLYVDEVNLLEDHLVDLLIDVAASGENVVEREGLSVRHPARFVLIGSGNPEEGELRPQLLDRFGLAVDVRTPQDLSLRVDILRRRDAFERDREAFCATWAREEERIRKRILAARQHLDTVVLSDAVVEDAARLCMRLGTDGLRGELTLMRAARALAALDGDDAVTQAHLRRVAAPALRHRLRRDPLEEADASARVARAVNDLWGAVGAATAVKT